MPVMHHRTPWLLAAACILAIGGAAWPAVASGQAQAEAFDHDSALAARRRGDILPLELVLSRVRPALGGEVVGVALERSGDRWTYRFRVLGADRNRATVQVDARTAQVIGRSAD